MPSAVELAAKFAHRAESIAEFEMRVAYVGHELVRLDPLDAVNVLAIVHQRAISGHARYCDLLLAVSVHLVQVGAGELRAMLRRVAGSVGLEELTEGVLSVGDASEEESPDPERVPDFGLGRPVTLGERKTLARTTNRDLLLRVVKDPDPTVIEIILRNPHLTEPDVIRLCARRPVSGGVLVQVFRSLRWARQYSVRLAILKNPNCPRYLALQLVLHLRSQDAEMVGTSPDIDAEVRARCKGRRYADTLH